MYNPRHMTITKGVKDFAMALLLTHCPSKRIKKTTLMTFQLAEPLYASLLRQLATNEWQLQVNRLYEMC